MTLRVAVLGAGAWGQNHVRIVASEPGCVLAGVADPDPLALERIRGVLPRCRLVADPHALLGGDVEAVVIASPAATHPALARAALAAGKHVLVEKPLAMDVAVAISLAELARSNRLVGMVGHLMVHHPAVIRLRELLRSGVLGTLHYLHSTRVNLGRLRRDENALWSFGPHDVSMIDLLLDRAPISVAARGQSVLQQGIEDVVFLTMRYETGEMAHVHLSWLSPRKERRLTLVCSQKMAEFDDVGTDKLKIYDRGYDRPPEFSEYSQFLTIRDGDVHIPQLPMQEPLRLQFRHFVDCIHSGAVPDGNLASAVRVTAVLEAAQRSLQQDGAPVGLAL
ncbi:MAG: Gfo/Idh/MocA family oxidoreductase [Deltaproteobacteria bacterium]|nr:Gfo/Idh/MocA family oxidoreductase [Deltaproteobacteria bacterium]MDQ3297513.1 Gfo/Idh/MocA family oxidoreductase [Myxococcota bacterium]